MLYNEVRPHRFSDVVGQKNIVKVLQNQVKTDSLMNLYIFGGQFGSGKTTLARIVALAANCEHLDKNGNPCMQCEHCRSILSGNCSDYMELDAASRTGVDDVRTIIEDVQYTPTYLKKKVYIIDEVHMLSKSAFNSLLKTLEEPPSYAIFVLCTTEIKSIPLTVQSRAARFLFGQISEDDIYGHLKHVSERMVISVDDAALWLIARNSDGAMRNAISLLEQASSIPDEGVCITEQNVQDMLGIADDASVFRLLREIFTGNTIQAVSVVNELVAKGKDLLYLIDDMLDIISDCIIFTCSKDITLIGNTENYRQQIMDLGNSVSKSLLCGASEVIMKLRTVYRRNPSRTIFIVNIVRISSTSAENNETLLLERIERLEKMVRCLQNQSGREKLDVCQEDCDRPVLEDLDDDDEQPDKEKDFSTQIYEIFSIFNMENMVQCGREEADLSTEEEFGDVLKDSDVLNKEYEIYSEAVKKKIALVDEICESDSALYSAVKEGCVMSVEGEELIYRTPLKPIHTIVNASFEAYHIPAVVKLDCAIEL